MVQTGVILVDLDHGDIAAKRDHLVRHLGHPSLEVASGGITDDGQAKRHLYWRLIEAASGEDVVRVAALRGLLAARVDGDPAFRSGHQPIRVAGTIHGKGGRRASVRILAQGAHEYELGELAEIIAGMPPMPGLPGPLERDRVGPGGLTPHDLATTTIAAGGQGGETRFTALSKVIGHWLRNARLGVCTIEAAWNAVQDHNAAMMVPPWEEDRLRREFDALLAKDIADKGHLPTRGQGGLEGDPTPIAPPLSDDAIAADFADSHGQNWKYVPAWGAWHQWCGNVWKPDVTGLVRELARQVCRSAARQASKPGEARHMASDKKMSAVLRVAAADPRIAVAPSRWDAHQMLLNTPSGVIDLTTAEISSHCPDLLISQMTTASRGSDCPRWTTFLREITDGDAALQAYLARLAGYCLTGSTREQAFAFLHGHGANGKSVFLQTLASIMGSYAATAALDTFMASRADRHLTELAGLRAARLVLVSETEAGRSWAEGRIKAVTGGEKLRANFMRRDHFEFVPQFKLLVAGNHRPALVGVGEAMRRRLHLVPFAVTIPAEHRDARLAEKLLAERDGILGWMLAGCAAWQREGLAPPACVMAAAEDYFEAEDLVGQWIQERCIRSPECTAAAAQLFQSWKAWAEEGGFAPGSQKSLGEALRARGFRPTTVRRGRGWSGIGIHWSSTSAEPGE
ncbi:phage/plasmid primase, P4 family [Microbaculum marinum]|uniref:Phage/plasmid primase, P4 family n=1 Tax=Microbaculum marinum TaxID=1764581 RepID=A0AAW9RBC7_9HYPH